MTHAIELLEKWEGNDAGKIVEVGKSTAHMLVTEKLGVRFSGVKIKKPQYKKPKTYKKSYTKSKWGGKK